MVVATQREQRKRFRPTNLRHTTEAGFAQMAAGAGLLKDLHLCRFNLKGKDLRGRDLSGSDLSGANLAGARLDGAILAGCDFSGADLHGATMVEADLRRADLSSARGLTPDQLRGALLDAAKLPDGLSFDGLDRVRDLVNRAEGQLNVLLLACASVAIIAWGSGHEKFFQAGAPLTLPGLDLPVPLSAFFVLAPLLLGGLYVGLSYTLRKLWLELANLPAQFPNQRGLYEQTAPSTPSFTAPAAEYLSTRGVGDYRARRGERRWMVLLVWWATPATMVFGVWMAYLPRHSWITWEHVLVAVATAAWGLASYRNMDFVLSGRFRKARPRRLARPGQAVPPATAGAPSASPASPRATQRRVRVGRIHVHGPLRSRRTRTGEPRTLRTRIRGLLAPVWAQPGARGIFAMAGVMLLLSGMSAGGAGCSAVRHRASEAQQLCNYFAADLAHASLPELRLPHGNLLRAFLYSANLEGAHLEEADLRYANLTSARLAGANLKDARLDRATLWEARLVGARLKEAEMPRADLRGALLRGAQAQGVDFTDADLRGVDWTGALMCGADLARARVDLAELRRARGWRRVTGVAQAGGGDSLRWMDGQTVPAYLDDEEAGAYLRWRSAWWQALHLPRGAAYAGTRVDSAFLIARIDAVDVTMGASRQRDKEELLADVRSRSRHSGQVLMVPALVKRIDKFHADVEKKARNHCVDLERDLPPTSGRPAGRGPVER